MIRISKCLCLTVASVSVGLILNCSLFAQTSTTTTSDVVGMGKIEAIGNGTITINGFEMPAHRFHRGQGQGATPPSAPSTGTRPAAKEIVIVLSNSTKLRGARGKTLTMSDLQVGTRIRVVGTPDGSNIDALEISKNGPRRRHGF